MEKEQKIELLPRTLKRWKVFNATAKTCNCFWCFFRAKHPKAVIKKKH